MRRPPGASAAEAPAGESAAALLARLEWTVLRRLDGLLQGDHATLRRGTGLDLADLRSYAPHDDVRHIDWNVTARLDEPHVRQFTEDRDLTAWFLMDLSGSVHVGGTRSRYRVATDFAAAMARWLTQRGDRVGALFYGADGVADLPPAGGRRQVLRLVQRLQAAQPQAAVAGAGTRLDALLHRAGRVLVRRSLVFVVSDFVSAPGWPAALGRLAQRHEVLAVRLVDPDERNLPLLGVVRFEDAESGETLRIDTADPGVRARHAAAVAAREAALRADFAASGVDVLEVATTDAVLDVLRRHAESKRLRRRAQAGATTAPRRPTQVAA